MFGKGEEMASSEDIQMQYENLTVYSFLCWGYVEPQQIWQEQTS